MNGKKALLRSPQGKDFLIHLQRQQGLILRLHILTRWGTSFRKRLENLYLARMVYRKETQCLIYYYYYNNGEVLIRPINRLNLLRSETYRKKGFVFLSLIPYPSLAATMIGSTLVKGHNNGEVLIRPINRLNLLRSETYRKKGFAFLSLISYPSLAATMIGSTLVKGHNKSTLVKGHNKSTLVKGHNKSTLVKGHNKMTDGFLKTFVANHIRSSPVVAFQRHSIFLQDVLKLVMHKYLSVFIQRREIFDRMQKYTLYNITPRLRDKSITLRQIWMQENDSGVANQDTGLFRWSDKSLLVKQLSRQKDIEENKYEGKHIDRMGRVSLTRTRWVPMVLQEAIRSTKPNQRVVLRSVYGDVRYIRANSEIERTITTRSGEFGSNMDPVKWNWKRRYFKVPEDLNSHEVPENLHLEYEGKHMDRTGRGSLTRTRRVPMILQEAIRSTKPDQKVVLKSVYRDMRYIRANSGMERTLTASSGELSSNMDLVKWDWKRKYFRGSENLDSNEATEDIGPLNQPEIIGPFNQKDLKLIQIQQKNLPVFTLRQEKFNRMQVDPLYAIPPPRQVKVKKTEGYFDSIPKTIKEYSKAIPLNGEKITLNGTGQIKSPILGKKEIENRGISIDYQKVADRVYDILTRRIIREKERMGELL